MNLLMLVLMSRQELCKHPQHTASHQRCIMYTKAHINTTEVFLFDTGVGQEGIDESHIHSNTLKNLLIF